MAANVDQTAPVIHAPANEKTSPHGSNQAVLWNYNK
jgi:hypothetical protein